MRVLLIPLLFTGVAVGCSGDAPTSADGATPNFGAAGNSGCYTVVIDFAASGAFPSFSGATTGDVEGTFDVLFDVGSTVFHGVVIGNEGVVTWNVTGGIIPELVGQTFRTTTSALTLTQPDNDPLIWEITGKDRALDGVAKANLTYNGTFDIRDLTPPFEVDLDYRGVICP